MSQQAVLGRPRLPVSPERPQLTFRTYAVALHIAARWAGGERMLASQLSGDGAPAFDDWALAERALNSYEDDMVLYAHRENRPFRTRIVPAELSRVSVRFPGRITYEAEGGEETLVCAGATAEGRTRVFGIRLAVTRFERSDADEPPRAPAILSLVLTAGRARVHGVRAQRMGRDQA
jgi:hypothetical protein